jgi:hypothetical protein
MPKEIIKAFLVFNYMLNSSPWCPLKAAKLTLNFWGNKIWLKYRSTISGEILISKEHSCAVSKSSSESLKINRLTTVEPVYGESAPIYSEIPMPCLDLLPLRLPLLLSPLKAHLSKNGIMKPFIVFDQKLPLIFMSLNIETKVLTAVQKIVLDFELIILIALHQMLEPIYKL